MHLKQENMNKRTRISERKFQDSDKLKKELLFQKHDLIPKTNEIRAMFSKMHDFVFCQS